MEAVGETCWFCEREPALAATAFRATVYGNKKKPPPAGRWPVDLKGDTARVSVAVPRCSQCASFQRREAAITLCGLVLGVVVFAGAYAPVALSPHPAFTLFGSVTATLVCFAIVGFIVGLVADVLVSRRVNRGMARRDARNYPDVIALTNCGWSYDPPQTDGV